MSYTIDFERDVSVVSCTVDHGGEPCGWKHFGREKQRYYVAPRLRVPRRVALYLNNRLISKSHE